MPRTRSAVPAPLLMVGSCVSLQFGAAIATPLLHELGSGLTTALRLLFAAVMLLAVHRPAVRAWRSGEWRSVVLFGLALGAMNGCFYAAIARIPLGVAVTIEFAGPLVLAAVLSRRVRDLVFVVVAAVAIVVLGLHGGTGTDRLDPVGVGFALAAAVCWALYILAGRSVGRRVHGSGPLAVGMTVGALAMFPFGVSGIPALSADPITALPLVAVALLSSFIPYSLEFMAMRRMSASTFGVLLALEPVFAGLAGLALLGQALDAVTIGAMVLVVGASVGSTLVATRTTRTTTPGDAAAVATGDSEPQVQTGPIPAHDASAPPTRPDRAHDASTADPAHEVTAPGTAPIPGPPPGLQADARTGRAPDETRPGSAGDRT